jgi:hypothetical protein
MDAVREAAAEPPPLPFPWRRYLACLGMCLIACGATTITVLKFHVTSLIDPVAMSTFAPAVLSAAAGLLLTVATLRLTRTFTSY